MFRNLLRSRIEAPAPTAKAAPPVTRSVIGTGATFSGTMKTDGDVQIDGTFDGDISAGGHVVIHETGKVEGDVRGKSLVVSGTVRGDVQAGSISVLRSGRVWGDLITGSLTTEEGAFIQGVITMQVDDDDDGEPVELPPELEEQVAEVVRKQAGKKKK